MSITHDQRFPNESEAYRKARDELLEAEVALRRQAEAVAVARRALPLGGEVPTNYVFKEGDNARTVTLSELFGDKQTLVAYSFMYGPNMEKPCPMCASLIDALNGSAAHTAQRFSLVVIAKSAIGRILTFSRPRGWNRLRIVSSADNTYNRDYLGENAEGQQMPMLNVFAKRDGKIHHAYATEMMLAPSDPGQDSRHVDGLSPLWSLLDFTPEGRGDFRAKLQYT